MSWKEDIKWMIVAGIAGAVAQICYDRYEDNRSLHIPIESRVSVKTKYDVTRDGLGDIVEPNGLVLVNCGNGTYPPLKEMERKEIENIEKKIYKEINAVKAKYKLVREPNDLRYYTKEVIRDPNAL